MTTYYAVGIVCGSIIKRVSVCPIKSIDSSSGGCWVFASERAGSRYRLIAAAAPQCAGCVNFIWLYGGPTYTNTRLTALFPGLPGWTGTRKVKPIWTLLNQETVSGSGISWAICKSAPRLDNHASTPPHFFYRLDALPAAQPTASKHWRHMEVQHTTTI